MLKAPFAWTKPGLELEIGIGDFEHLAAPFRLRGKVRELSGASHLSAGARCPQNSGREWDSLIRVEISLIA